MKTRFLFFSGKGGVGKTSVSCATALHLSKKAKVLLISTDPAHSLSDCFGVKIGGRMKGIRKNLFAVEIDPAMAMEEYMEKMVSKMPNHKLLEQIGGGFDMASAPGIDEIAAFDKFLQFMESDEYDYVIFDTAPTGHTLRLLSFPDVLESYIGKLIMLRMRFAGIAGMIKKFLPFGEEGGEGTGDAIEEMKKRIEKAKKIMASRQVEYNIVLIPEEMSIAESERALEAVKRHNIRACSIIINNIIPENTQCKFCSAKRKQQQERIREIKKRFRGMRITQARLFKEEIRGFGMLERLASELYKP